MISTHPKVAIFFTGGTIAMRREEDGSVRPALHLADLLQELHPDQLPGFNGTHTFSSAQGGADYAQEILLPVEWADLPSPHMTPELMFRLAKDVDSMLSREDIVGAVVAHGTDVMEETAFMLDLVVASPKPVIITGAMRSFGEAGYDGLRNLAAAIRTCFAPLPPGLGTLLLMTDKLFSPREVTKTHSMGVDSFNAPGAGPVGTCVAGSIQIYRAPLPHKPLAPQSIDTAVDFITLAPGMDGRFLAHSRACGCHGIVVAGFGAGNVPPGVLEEIRLTLKENIPVVLTSRCIEGGVWPVYGYSGGANHLRDMGVILGGNLPGHKARILLMAALGMARELAPTGGAELCANTVRNIFAAYPNGG